MDSLQLHGTRRGTTTSQSSSLEYLVPPLRTFILSTLTSQNIIPRVFYQSQPLHSSSIHDIYISCRLSPSFASIFFSKPLPTPSRRTRSNLNSRLPTPSSPPPANRLNNFFSLSHAFTSCCLYLLSNCYKAPSSRLRLSPPPSAANRTLVSFLDMEAIATSFSARRPAAGSLPAFSLPPPNAEIPSKYLIASLVRYHN